MPARDAVAYKVKSGDSLWSIASAHYGHGVTWPAVFAFNQQSGVREHVRPALAHPDTLQAGQTIFLPRRLYVEHFKRQPGQRHAPGRIGPTRPAGSGARAGLPPAPRIGRPAAATRAPSPQPGRDPAPMTTPTPNGDSGATLVNKFGVKIDTAQHRRFKTQFEAGLFTVEVECKGTVVVRHDATVPVATFSRDTFEYQYKNEMLNAAGALTAVTKLQVDWRRKTGSCELMFTTNLIAGNKLPISLGPVIDDKGPALRGKVDYKGVKGKVHDILYFVQDDETLTLQVTVRLRRPPPREPPTEPPPGVHVLVPAGVPVPAPAAPGAQPVPVPGPDLHPAPLPPQAGPDVLPVPPPPHPNEDLAPMTTPTPQSAHDILLHAGKWAGDHPVAAALIGTAVVGLVILALPEEAAGAAAAAGVGAAGRWLLLRAGAAAALGAAGS